MDPSTSRLKLFEKASLTASPGGYRLLASQVDNSTDYEKMDMLYLIYLLKTILVINIFKL